MKKLTNMKNVALAAVATLLMASCQKTNVAPSKPSTQITDSTSTLTIFGPKTIPVGGAILLETGRKGPGLFEWRLNGIVLANETGPTLVVTAPGSYVVSTDPSSVKGLSEPFIVTLGSDQFVPQ